MKRVLCLFWLGILWAGNGFSASFSSLEMQLNAYFQRLKTPDEDERRLKLNDSICLTLSELLQKESSFSYSFSRTEGLGKRSAKDGKVAVYTWSFQLNSGENFYCGFVQKRSGRKIEIFPLKEKSSGAFVPSDEQKIALDEWYGALYYEIVPFKTKRNGTAYALLGWAQNTPRQSMKVIDVLWFEEKKAWLGLEVFEVVEKEFLSRVVLRYSGRVSSTLIYEEKNGRIVFDHLSPVNSVLAGDFQHYVPDNTYDAYKKRAISRTWRLLQNVEVGD